MLRQCGALGLAAVLLPACLSQTYAVSRAEMLRLARTAPEARGQQVRVVQQFVTADEPPRAQVVQPGIGLYVGGTVPVPPDRRPRRGGGGGGGGVGGGGGGGGGNVGNNHATAALLLIAGAGVAVGLAASEGARYDGWVQVHPLHPVHLYGPGGEHTWVPLANLTEEHAAWAEQAVLTRDEGPWQPLGRAPLNRVGMTYSVDFGSAGMDVQRGDAPWGFYGRLALGGFPLNEIGILATLGFGWGDGEFDDSVFNARYGLELQLIPIAIDRVHLGVYGEAGLVHRNEDLATSGVVSDALVAGGGGIVQLDLTTRLALTLRGGATMLPQRDGGQVLAPQITVGMAIY